MMKLEFNSAAQSRPSNASPPLSEPSNHSYHISGFTAKVTTLCQTAGKTDGRGGVTDDKKVVFALRGFGVAGDVIIV